MGVKKNRKRQRTVVSVAKRFTLRKKGRLETVVRKKKKKKKKK